jgi:hypothetical protein
VNRQGAHEQQRLAAPRVERLTRLGKTSTHVRDRLIEPNVAQASAAGAEARFASASIRRVYARSQAA